MFKTGIYKIEQLNQSKNFKTIFGKDRKISITLYSAFSDNIRNSDITERILLYFSDERGTYKRTYSNRFEEFDRQILKEIQNQVLLDGELVVHDVAISDGRTACDFFEKLSVQFPKLKYYASDYDSHIFVIQSGQTKIVLNKEGVLLEIVFPPFVFNIIGDSLCYPVNHFVRFVLEKTIVKKMMLKYKNGILKTQDLYLFCPRALKLANQDVRFQLMQHNLLKVSPLAPQAVNIFRAMNILNLSYFSPEEYKVIIDHIFNSLSDHGLFITGSNLGSNSTVHGGIFQKKKDRFEKLWHSGEGSQVESLILDYRLSNRN